MLKNHFKVALRNLFRYKFHSVQNIVGLSLALAISVIGLLYIFSELSYEKSYQTANRVFRINTDFKASGQVNQSALTPDQMGALWQKYFPEVETYARVFTTDGFAVTKGVLKIRQDRGAFIDTSLFSVFKIPFISKAVGTPLSEPNTVVITESMALKYFGQADVSGRMLGIDDLSYGVKPKKTCKVVGVIRDFPKNTQLQFDFFFPIKDLQYGWNRALASNNFNTFLLLKPEADYEKMNETFKRVTATEIYPQVSKFLGLTPKSWKDFVNEGNMLEYNILPLLDIHLSIERGGQLIPTGSKLAVKVLTVLIAFTILMASVNFVNLSTALAMKRAKQIGILKVLGSSRRNLIFELLLEAFLLIIASAVIGILLAVTLLPFANTILNVQLLPSDLKQVPIIIAVLVLIVVNTLLSGFYPAFYLSGLNAINALQGSNGLKVGGGLLRKSLTLFQFVVAISLIGGTVVIYNQLQFLKTVDIGYERDQVYVIDNISVLQSNKDAFKNEIKTISGVVTVSMSSITPLNPLTLNRAAYGVDAAKTSQDGIPMDAFWIDDQYIKALDIKIKTGENFGLKENFRKVIINEAAQHVFGLENPIGSKIYSGDTLGSTVIGVIKNYHYGSFRQSVAPLLLYFAPASYADYGLIRFSPKSSLGGQLKQVNAVWKQFVTNEPLKGYFLDEAFNKTFKDDETISKATMLVATFTISICCIGLFGLITFLTAIKRKEIAVRKILGASPAAIIGLLCKDFFALVTLAFLVTIPIIWWTMNAWLQDFVYRINISWWMISIGFGIAIAITAATAGYQALMAAIVKPVDSLREG